MNSIIFIIYKTIQFLNYNANSNFCSTSNEYTTLRIFYSLFEMFIWIKILPHPGRGHMISESRGISKKRTAEFVFHRRGIYGSEETNMDAYYFLSNIDSPPEKAVETRDSDSNVPLRKCRVRLFGGSCYQLVLDFLAGETSSRKIYSTLSIYFSMWHRFSVDSSSYSIYTLYIVVTLLPTILLFIYRCIQRV